MATPGITPEQDSYDLKADAAAARAVQLLSLLLAAAFVAAAFLLDLPLASGWATTMTVAVTLGASVLYMLLHETTHGVLLTAFSGQRSRYALRFPYLTTGNDAFVGRSAFLAVALGPLIIWGVVLLGLFAVLPADFHLTLYILSGLNVAGSAGDLYQAWRVAKLPATATIRDNGARTTIRLA